MQSYPLLCAGSVQVIGATLGSVVVNIAGRRSLLIASTGLCSLSMGLLGTVFFLKKHEPESVIIQVISFGIHSTMIHLFIPGCWVLASPGVPPHFYICLHSWAGARALGLPR